MGKLTKKRICPKCGRRTLIKYYSGYSCPCGYVNKSEEKLL